MRRPGDRREASSPYGEWLTPWDLMSYRYPASLSEGARPRPGGEPPEHPGDLRTTGGLLAAPLAIAMPTRRRQRRPDNVLALTRSR
jgi:hypothetical protein